MKRWGILAAEFKVVSAVLEAGSKSKRLHTGRVLYLFIFLILCHSSETPVPRLIHGFNEKSFFLSSCLEKGQNVGHVSTGLVDF